MRSLACLLWAALAATPPLFGEEPTKPTASPSESNAATPAAGHSVHGEAFDDGPRQAARILPGMGKADFPVTTASPEAQAFINQGVAQLHSFYYFEAERSFRQAAKLDPACPMAYWGLAMSNVNNTKRAKGFLKEARAKAEKAKLTARETLYLNALADFHKEGADDKARRQGLLKGLETIVQDYPGDLDARAWLAMVTWQNSHTDGIGSRQAVDTLIESVMAVEPMHPGAHHYRIHLWDHQKAARAEKSAATYARTAPGIAHAWHMPGHTYDELKRYADAAYQQEGSARVDHAAMARDRIMPFEIHNYAHNNQWLATSLSHIGRVKDAIALSRDLVEQPRDPNKNGPNDGGSSQRNGRARWPQILARYELWDELIAAADSGVLDWADNAFEKRERAYYLGLAYAAKGDLAKLDEQIDSLRKQVEAAKPKADEKKDGENPPPAPARGPATGAAAAQAELEGYRHLAKDEIGPAFEAFARASNTMRGEALARAHLAARNYGLAEVAAKAAVEKGPNQLPPLAAYVEILHAVGKDDLAKAEYAKLALLARDADPDLPVLKRLASVVSGWKGSGWNTPAVETGSDENTAGRIDLTTLGPLTWSPFAARPIEAVDTAGQTWKLSDRAGKNVLAIFYLGGKCAHCMQQLQTFGKEIEALKALNVEVVAISTDDLEATKALKANADEVKFPMPLLADPSLGLFKAYQAFNDFEDEPLHGTYLIDAEGNVRYQRISSDPFLDVDFIKKEAARVNTLLKARKG